jgi:hypothetical protein
VGATVGKAGKPDGVKIFLALLFSSEEQRDTALAAVCGVLGEIEDSCGPVAFDYTGYYTPEMGSGLRKSYYIFKRLALRDELARLKVFTNSLESQFLCDGNRRINLDPGYLTRDKLVLATTKDFFHRLYLSDGIFAEVTLHFKSKNICRYFSWTYPDYRDEGFQRFILKSRAVLGEELLKLNKNDPE